MGWYLWHCDEGVTLRLEQSHVDTVPRTGAADAYIATIRRDTRLEGQLQALSVADVVAYLKGFGAWSEAELSDHETNLDRLLWVAIGDIQDNPDDYLCETSDR